MKTITQYFIGAAALFLCGCFPQERFWWSPDGARAVVIVGDGKLHIVKPGGGLDSPVEAVQLNDDYPIGVSWVPDGSGFVLHRVLARATWEEARVLIPADEVTAIERHAAGIPHLLQAAAAVGGGGNAIDSLLEVVSIRDKDLWTAALFCAWEKQQAVINAALAAAPKGGEILAGLKEEKTPFRVHELILIKVKNDRPDGEPHSIVRSIHPVLLPKVSPKFPAVAYWKALDEEKNLVLEVSSLDGKSRISTKRSLSATFDWTTDGRSLVMAVPVSDEDALVQTIQVATVLHESGALVSENVESRDLAVAIMPTPARLCVLPDNRVLFASQPAKLPTPSGTFNIEPRLFLSSADGKSVNEVPTAPGDLPANLSFFVASPDGKYVAVVESDTIAVAVVELSTGKTEIVSPPHQAWSCRTMPAWKSAAELTFAALHGSPATPRWMLWKAGEGVRSLSEQWPPSATEGWLSEKKDSAPQPVNKP